MPPKRVDFSLSKIQNRSQSLKFYSRTGPTFEVLLQSRILFWSFTPEQNPFLKFYSRAESFFEVLLQSRILFWQSGLKRQCSNVKNPSCFPQSDRSSPNFLIKKYTYLLLKDTECVPVIIIISKLYSNKLMLPVKAFVSCSLMSSFLFCYTWAKYFKLSGTGISLSQDIHDFTTVDNL